MQDNQHLFPHRKFILSALVILLCYQAPAQFQHGIKADYYNGVDFHSFVLSRIEKKIGFTRKLKSPAPGVGREFFSIRYTGSIKAPKTGLYNFYVIADDGVRVRVNHQLLVDAWIDQEATTYSGSIMLDKDERYDIEIEYYNSIVHSVFNIRWELPMETHSLFDLGHQPVITEIPTSALMPVRSQAKQRTHLLVGRALPTGHPESENKSVITPAKKISNKRSDSIIKEAEPIVLKTVTFDQQSSVLKDGAARELDQLIKYLKKFERKKIQIFGYTDYLGDSLDNQILSEQRAKTIASYLEHGGIDKSRISSEGFGGRFPLVVSKNLKDRNANRRVEFKIVD
jgi:outer membrane protein OmpA-like peptidoglycan-associated protein